MAISGKARARQIRGEKERRGQLVIMEMVRLEGERLRRGQRMAVALRVAGWRSRRRCAGTGRRRLRRRVASRVGCESGECNVGSGSGRGSGSEREKK